MPQPEPSGQPPDAAGTAASPGPPPAEPEPPDIDAILDALTAEIAREYRRFYGS